MFLIDALMDWLKQILVGGTMSNLEGMFDMLNTQIGTISDLVGQTPQAWNSDIFHMLQTLSDNVMLPIASMILTFVAAVELMQMVIDRNNFHDIDTWMFFRWTIKTFVAVLLVTNTWDIVMAVFDVSQHIVSRAAGIVGSTTIDASTLVDNMKQSLESQEAWALVPVFVLSLVLRISMVPIIACIVIVIFGRMIEIYMVVSVAPIPMATMMGKEMGSIGQNYLRSLFALGFQGFFIIVCVAIYGALTQSLVVGDDLLEALIMYTVYTVLLCFTLFKTSGLAKSIFAR